MLTLELHEYRDGTLRLYYEDSLHGEDATFILSPDGSAAQSRHDHDVSDPVNLHDALRALMARVEAQHEAFEVEQQERRRRRKDGGAL